MIRELRRAARRELAHLIDVLSGGVPLAAPLICLRPGCTRTRDKVTGVEAQILAGRGHIRCRCGSRMRPAPDTGHHITHATTYHGDPS